MGFCPLFSKKKKKHNTFVSIYHDLDFCNDTSLCDYFAQFQTEPVQHCPPEPKAGNYRFHGTTRNGLILGEINNYLKRLHHWTIPAYISEYQRNKCRVWAGFPGDPVLQTEIAAVRMCDVSLPQGFPNGGRQAGEANIQRVFVCRACQWIHQRVNNTLSLSASLGSERKQRTWPLKPALPRTRD